MNNRIVLISCAKTKLPHLAKAEDIYIGSLFKYSIKYAKILNPDAIYILSAKHGLLNLDQEIEPYEQTLNNMLSVEIKEWSTKVLTQLEKVASLEMDEFTFLAGIKYREYLLPHLKNSVIPLKGKRLGEQIQHLKYLTQ